METDQVGRKLTVNIFKSQNLAGMNTTTITEKKPMVDWMTYLSRTVDGSSETL